MSSKKTKRNKYDIVRTAPSRQRGWKRKLGAALWTAIGLAFIMWGLVVAFEYLSAWWDGREAWTQSAGCSAQGAEALTSEAQPSYEVPKGKAMLRAGASEWVAALVLGVLGALAVWRLITGARVERQPTMEDGEGWADKPVPLEIADPLAGDGLKPELQTMPRGLTRRDAAEIARAAAAEIELCRRMVDGAMHALSVEDYGDALAGASRRLGQVRVTLRELGMTFDQGGLDRA